MTQYHFLEKIALTLKSKYCELIDEGVKNLSLRFCILGSNFSNILFIFIISGLNALKSL